MPHSKNILRYADVHPLLDLALSTGICRYRGSTPKEAYATRHRLNTLRVILERTNPAYSNLMIALEKPQTLVITRRALAGTIESEHTVEDLEPKTDPLADAEAMMEQLMKDIADETN